MIQIGKLEALMALLLSALVLGLIGYKRLVLGYTMASVDQEPGYQVTLKVDVEGSGRDLNVRFPLPMQTERQSIRREVDESGVFQFRLTGNREANWFAPSFGSKQALQYKFFAQTQARDFTLENQTIQPSTDFANFAQYLNPTELVQTEDPEIESLAWPGQVSVSSPRMVLRKFSM